MTELQRIERAVNVTLGKALAFGIYVVILGLRELVQTIRRRWS
jgi:hypothetical protein